MVVGGGLPPTTPIRCRSSQESIRTSPDTPHGAMETTTIPPSAPPAARARPLAAVRRYAGRWGLIAALAALPVYYGIHDLTAGYQAGFVEGHAVIRHDLSN